MGGAALRIGGGGRAAITPCPGCNGALLYSAGGVSKLPDTLLLANSDNCAETGFSSPSST